MSVAPPADAGTHIPPAPRADPPFTIPAAALGTWTGYREGLSTSLVSDVVTLRLTAAADGSGSVSAVLGTAAPPAPATDPNTFWPASRNNDRNGVDLVDERCERLLRPRREHEEEDASRLRRAHG